MEILNQKGRVARLGIGVLSLALVTILIVFSALVLPFGKSGEVALADNAGSIGSGGGAVEIADVTEDLVSNVYSSREQGRKLKITMPLSTVSVYFAYEVDTNEQVYAISGDSEISEDIPYLLHEGGVEKFEVTTKTLGIIESSWTNITEVYEKQVFYIEVHYNGTLYVECALNGETDRLKAEALVKDIDCFSPEMSACVPIHGRVLGAIDYRCTFEDASNVHAIATARSGLAEILILRTDLPLDQLTEESINGGGVERILSWSPLVSTQIETSEILEFTISKDGYYYYFVVDRVGNLQINVMFNGNKFSIQNQQETDSRFFITDTTAQGTVVQYPVKNNMIVMGETLDEYKGTVNSEVYIRAEEAYAKLLTRFLTGEALTDCQSVTNAYNSFIHNEYKAFQNAFSVGASYEVKVINDDLISGSIKCLNLSAETVSSLGGDKVEATFIASRYEKKDLDSELLSLYGGERVKAYKLSYALTVNGVASTIPKKALIYEIFGLSESASNVKIYLKTANGYFIPEQISGENWVRFTQEGFNSGEYFLLYEESASGEDLLPLWISLGVVGGALVVGGVVLIVLWKKGLLKKKIKEQAEEPCSIEEKE